MPALFKNVYFLYFIIFMTVTNILGYATMKRLDVVLLFLLFGLLINQFTKNMSVILLSALLLTNSLVMLRPNVSFVRTLA